MTKLNEKELNTINGGAWEQSGMDFRESKYYDTQKLADENAKKDCEEIRKKFNAKYAAYEIYPYYGKFVANFYTSNTVNPFTL